MRAIARLETTRVNSRLGRVLCCNFSASLAILCFIYSCSLHASLALISDYECILSRLKTDLFSRFPADNDATFFIHTISSMGSPALSFALFLTPI
jgi:hypothetical protein